MWKFSLGKVNYFESFYYSMTHTDVEQTCIKDVFDLIRVAVEWLIWPKEPLEYIHGERELERRRLTLIYIKSVRRKNFLK